MNIEVLYFENDNGKSPYLDWENKPDTVARAAVRIRINRVRLGNFWRLRASKRRPFGTKDSSRARV